MRKAIVATQKQLRDFLDALHSPAAVRRAEPIDEYRELAMLALVWERSALEAGAPAAPLSRVEHKSLSSQGLCAGDLA